MVAQGREGKEENEQSEASDGMRIIVDAGHVVLEDIPDAEALDLGLFTSFPSPRGLLWQCIPVFWMTMLAVWPELLSKHLQLVWCIPVAEQRNGEERVTQRMLIDPDLVCWGDEHFIFALLAGIGIFVYCVGIPVALFLRIWSLRDRQSVENYRKFGYFIQGLEPAFWWWDVVVKRLDVGLMMVVTFTSMANDEKVKLLLFPLISGVYLSLCAWCKPYVNDQASMLDLLEYILQLTRFCLFGTVSVVLIFAPGKSLTLFIATALLLMLGMSSVYFSIHVVAQLLRSVSDEEEDDSHGASAMSSKGSGSLHNLQPQRSHLSIASKTKALGGKLKRGLLSRVLPIFSEAADERLRLEWSMGAEALEIKSSGKRGGKLISYLKVFRAFLLRLGRSVQIDMVVQAQADFDSFWLAELGQSKYPRDKVRLLCALATSCRSVPATAKREDLRNLWISAARKMMGSQTPAQSFSPTDLSAALKRLTSMPFEDAVKLVQEVDTLISEAKPAISSAKGDQEISDNMSSFSM